MRVTIHVEDTDGEALRYEVERRVRAERSTYAMEEAMPEPILAPAPAPASARRKTKKRR